MPKTCPARKWDIKVVQDVLLKVIQSSVTFVLTLTPSRHSLTSIIEELGIVAHKRQSTDLKFADDRRRSFGDISSLSNFCFYNSLLHSRQLVLRCEYENAHESAFYRSLQMESKCI